MKKVSILILALILTVSFAGCESKKEDEKPRDFMHESDKKEAPIAEEKPEKPPVPERPVPPPVEEEPENPVEKPTEFEYYGDAKLLADNSIELTPCLYHRAGSVWYKNPFDTRGEFKVTFSYWAGGGRGETYNGADGILCMFSDAKGLGADGGSLGFRENGVTWGIELDSYQYNPNDPSEKHLAILKGQVTNHMKYINTDKTDDSRWHTVCIECKPSMVKVYLDGEFVCSTDEIDILSTSYIGFSAATGDGRNRHLIKNFSVD